MAEIDELLQTNLLVAVVMAQEHNTCGEAKTILGRKYTLLHNEVK